jgi:hypothetical protein
VLPTSRNAKGVDIVIYSQDAQRTHTVQVKALTGAHAVPFGASLATLIAQFVIVCRKVVTPRPEVFVLTSEEVNALAHVATGKRGTSYWLETRSYLPHHDAWDKIGSGL